MTDHRQHSGSSSNGSNKTGGSWLVAVRRRRHNGGVLACLCCGDTHVRQRWNHLTYPLRPAAVSGLPALPE